MNRCLVALALMLGLAGCQASAPDAVSSPTPTGDSVGLQGQVLLALDGLYLANADGTHRERVYGPDEYYGLARISPDRTSILTIPGTNESGALGGGTLSLDGSTFEPLPQADETLILIPGAWSPDGSRVAFEGWDESDPSRTGIYTARLDGTDLLRVTTSPGLPHDSPLDWSPDGRQLLFYRAVRAEPDFPIDLGGALWVVNADGSDAHALDTGDVLPWWQARWSPDGSTIAFVEERLQPSGALWTVGADGTNLTEVFEDAGDRSAYGPVWSPDGSKIMFSIHPHSDMFQHPANEIHVINADGSGLTLVVGGPGFKYVTDWWAGP